MSNLLKSKIFFGVMIVAVVLVAGAFTAEAAYTHTVTLKQGSSGAQVSSLQTTLGGLAVDGNFGPMTKAGVMAFQSTNGLVADGVVGPLTGAALAGAPVMTGGTYPAGCSSASGFSTTTGLSCGLSLPAGCMPGYLFSTTTGASCTGGTTPIAPLAGGAGSVTLTELSSPSNAVKVGEGEVATQVFGLEYEADDDSDLSLTNIKITLSTAGTGSNKLNRYAKNVSVWYNGVKVGSALASEFSEDSNVYTKSISLSNVIIRAGLKGNVYIAVDAVDNLDSADVGSAANTWTLTVSSTRYQDALGVVLTDSTASIVNTFIFNSLASTADLELKVNLASNTPVASTVKVSTTTDTNKVELLRFTMKAQGSAMVIDQIPVSFTTSGTLFETTSNVTLKVGSKVFNESIAAGTSATTLWGNASTVGTASTAIRIFNNLNLQLAENETITGIVLADINDVEALVFVEGNTLLASLTSAIVAATSDSSATSQYIDVEDVNGDQLVTGDRTGSAIGNQMTFRSTGVNTVMGTPTYANTTDTNGLITSVTYTIPVAVTAFGNTLYIGQSAQLATAATASNAFALVVETAALPTTESTSATTSITLSSSNATIETNGFRLDDGQTKNFTVTVTMTAGTDNTSHRFRLDTIRTFTEAGLVTATNSDLLPTENYRTGFQYINN